MGNTWSNGKMPHKKRQVGNLRIPCGYSKMSQRGFNLKARRGRRELKWGRVSRPAQTAPKNPNVGCLKDLRHMESSRVAQRSLEMARVGRTQLKLENPRMFQSTLEGARMGQNILECAGWFGKPLEAYGTSRKDVEAAGSLRNVPEGCRSCWKYTEHPGRCMKELDKPRRLQSWLEDPRTLWHNVHKPRTFLYILGIELSRMWWHILKLRSHPINRPLGLHLHSSWKILGNSQQLYHKLSLEQYKAFFANSLTILFGVPFSD